MQSISNKFKKLLAIIREDGVGTMFKRVWQWIETRFIDSGDTLWFNKQLVTGGQPLELEGATIRKAATSADHELLDRVRPLDPAVQALRESAGGARWMVCDSTGELAFCCWTFSKAAIVVEKPALTLPLPENTFQLEDSYVPRAMRGSRGSLIALDMLGTALLEELGVSDFQLLTKVDAENAPARKILDRSGFNVFAVVTATRLLSRFTRWRVEQKDPTVFPGLSGLADA